MLGAFWCRFVVVAERDPTLVVSHLVVSGFVCRLGLLLVCKCLYMADSSPFTAVAFYEQPWLPFRL